MIPAIPSPESSTTWSDHGARPPCRVRLVLAERERAVGHRRDEPRAPAGEARTEAPLHDVLVGLEPELVRRHRPLGVVVEQRGQRVHVVALERVDVALQEGAPARRPAGRPVRRRRPASTRAWHGHAGGRCSRTRRSCRGAPRPRRRASEGPRAGSARRAVAAAGAAARPRTRAGSTRGRRRHPLGLRPTASRGCPGRARSRRPREGHRRASGRPTSAGPMSIGSSRRLRPLSASRQTLVAIRYSHDRTADRPSNRSNERHARTSVSWTASSASNAEPSIR